MCAKQVPYTMGKQVSFDLACECVRGIFDVIGKASNNEALRPFLDKFVSAVAAIPAAIIACVMSHPGDMVLTTYYNGGAQRSKSHASATNGQGSSLYRLALPPYSCSLTPMLSSHVHFFRSMPLLVRVSGQFRDHNGPTAHRKGRHS